MNKEEHEKRLAGYYTLDCSVRDKNIFYFVLYEDYTKWSESKWDPDSDDGPADENVPKRVLMWMRHEPEGKQWSHANLRGIPMMFGETCTKPKPQFVGVAGSIVYSVGSGERGFEKNIPTFDQGGPFRNITCKSRRIDGWLYVCGGDNSLGKRVANSQWQSFTKGMPNPKNLDNILRDVDGFSESDIYIVGTKGSVYHFDGKKGRKTTLPTDMDFQSLCCAGDGFVYISGLHGATWKGRGDQWQCLYQGHREADPLPGMSLGFKDMVWYQDRVWCTSDYGLWIIKDDKLEAADVPRFVLGCAGNLSAADGVLLLAGHGGAAFLENGQWQAIY
jgi:hypothetical protein